MNTRSTPRDVEALQLRAHEYMRQQVEQMDDWDKAFYREWTSLIPRNALAFPYAMGEPMERESEAQTLMATPIRGYAGGSAASTDTPVQGILRWSLQDLEYQSFSTDDGRNVGGWNDNVRIDPNYYSLPGLELQCQ